MASNLNDWEEKIRIQRKNTPFREFVKDIASWFPIAFYRYENGTIGKFPREGGRVKNPVESRKFHEIRDSLTRYGRPYGGDFFYDFSEILKNIPIEALKQFEGTVNTEYADIALGKNIYLTVVGFDSENVAYSCNVKEGCLNVYDSVLVWKNCENIRSCRYITESFNVFYSQYIHSCRDIWLSSDMIGCQECVACSGLRNAKYCIENQPFPKEEYERRKGEYLTKVYRFVPFYEKMLRLPVNPEITNYLCEDISAGYMNYRVKNGRNLFFVGGEDSCENMYDVISAGILENRDFYGVMGAGIGSSDIYCSCEITKSSKIYYSYLLESCSFCLGCVGLKNASYCILNTQYSKEEWFFIAEKIFSDLDTHGQLGKFFPGAVNPFFFNDTLASLIYDDFTKESVENEWFLWREKPIQVDIPADTEIINAHTLDQFQWPAPDGSWYIDPSIQKKIIRDAKGDSYRIIPMEYDFLMKYGLPLPANHWLDRIKMGFKM